MALTGLTLFFAFPGRNYCITATALLAELYANSILVVLNSRIQIVGGRATAQTTIDFSSNPSFVRNVGGADLSVATGVSRASHILSITREVPLENKMNDEMELKAIEVCLRSCSGNWRVLKLNRDATSRQVLAFEFRRMTRLFGVAVYFIRLVVT